MIRLNLIFILIFISQNIVSQQNKNNFFDSKIEEIMKKTYLVYVKNDGKSNEIRICCEKILIDKNSTNFYYIQKFKKSNKVIVANGICRLNFFGNSFTIIDVFIYDLQSNEFCKANYNKGLYSINFCIENIQKQFKNSKIFKDRFLNDCQL